MKQDAMCSTCGFETTARSKDEADAAHAKFDPAHEPGWYAPDATIDNPKRVWS